MSTLVFCQALLQLESLSAVLAMPMFLACVWHRMSIQIMFLPCNKVTMFSGTLQKITPTIFYMLMKTIGICRLKSTLWAVMCLVTMSTVDMRNHSCSCNSLELAQWTLIIALLSSILKSIHTHWLSSLNGLFTNFNFSRQVFFIFMHWIGLFTNFYFCGQVFFIFIPFFCSLLSSRFKSRSRWRSTFSLFALMDSGGFGGFSFRLFSSEKKVCT